MIRTTLDYIGGNGLSEEPVFKLRSGEQGVSHAKWKEEHARWREQHT